MADMVWAVSAAVCMLFVLSMILYLRKKKQADQEAEEKDRKQRQEATVAASMMGGTMGKKLTLSSEELDRNFDRLCLLFSRPTAPARKEAPKPAPTPPKPATAPPKPAPEAPKPASEAPKPVPSAPKEAPKLPPAAPQEDTKPAEAPKHRAGPLKAELKAKPESPKKASEHIKSEMDQAVKETL
ncbi:hypothetical protein AGOR_G00230400 [Albula goreensis]|uniref:Uncharacterized protein n=1 Tax=Albula goreensis TaxID=1534307 RepID=A0A8T3CK20_9TELE|nr:hypothetical protein AGOR_G00230400 [Albula goreensis]